MNTFVIHISPSAKKLFATHFSKIFRTLSAGGFPVGSGPKRTSVDRLVISEAGNAVCGACPVPAWKLLAKNVHCKK